MSIQTNATNAVRAYAEGHDSGYAKGLKEGARRERRVLKLIISKHLKAKHSPSWWLKTENLMSELAARSRKFLGDGSRKPLL